MTSRIVYSSRSGRHCPECGRPVADCACRKKPPPPSGDGVVRVRREVAGRGGKTVTTISGVPLLEDALRELASEIKRRVGSGGSVKGGVIEIQGDFCETVIELLRAKGYTVKRAGG
jgi:translation initiation factor 1